MRRVMKYIQGLLIFLSMQIVLTNCELHEWPDVRAEVPVELQATYNVAIQNWTFMYSNINGETLTSDTGSPNVSQRLTGNIRYTIRAYEKAATRSNQLGEMHEFVFTKDIADAYDLQATLYLPAGEYDFYVWAEFLRAGSDETYYNSADFAAISRNSAHEGNNDYYDAFRGHATAKLGSSIYDSPAVEFEIEIHRPLAKFELVTTDLQKYINREVTRALEDNKHKSADEATRAISLDDYKVVIYYVGFVPNVYNLFTDKPIDSTTGLKIESEFKQLSDNEASLGFDYVFVGQEDTAVTLQVGVYDSEGNEVSMTSPFKVPLKRNHHSIVRGEFLMEKASGGIDIDTGYDGDHNFIVP